MSLCVIDVIVAAFLDKVQKMPGRIGRSEAGKGQLVAEKCQLQQSYGNCGRDMAITVER
jgi:hypothetical protein